MQPSLPLHHQSTIISCKPVGAFSNHDKHPGALRWNSLPTTLTWPGDIKRDGESVTTLDGLHVELDESFTLAGEPFKIPFVIRETANKYQHTFSEVTLWNRK